jgi:hypothetical protein
MRGDIYPEITHQRASRRGRNSPSAPVAATSRPCLSLLAACSRKGFVAPCLPALAREVLEGCNGRRLPWL